MRPGTNAPWRSWSGGATARCSWPCACPTERLDLRDARFYYRDGCHLCEEMAAVLFRGWPGVAAAMEWREVDARPEWREAFGLQIPVLALGDEVVCALRADPEQLEAYFGPRATPL